MKLFLLTEAIDPQDFYDFYALNWALVQKNIEPYRDELKQQYDALVDYIYRDHMKQFGQLILDRFSEKAGPDAFDPVPELQRAFKHYGVKFKKNQKEDVYDPVQTPQTDLVGLFRAVRNWAQEDNSRSIGYFTSGDGRWVELSKAYDRFTKMDTNTEQKALVIDHIYKLLHHGGAILDYFDERKWLESALNRRDNAGIHEILRLASPAIRRMISIPINQERRSTVSPAEIAVTGLRRHVPGNWNTLNQRSFQGEIQINWWFFDFGSTQFIRRTLVNPGDEKDTGTWKSHQGQKVDSQVIRIAGELNETGDWNFIQSDGKVTEVKRDSQAGQIRYEDVKQLIIGDPIALEKQEQIQATLKQKYNLDKNILSL